MAAYERRFSFVTAAALITAIAGCACERMPASRVNPAAPSSSSDSTPRTFVISGVVVEPAPGVRPIAGARVQVIVSPHTFSDDRGAFTLPGVAAGRAILEVSKDGYQTSEQQVVVANDMQLAITLTPAVATTASAAPAVH
jgi:hypothetical protein